MIYFSPQQRMRAFNVCPQIGFKFLLKMFAVGSAGSFVSSVSVFQSAIPAISPGLSDGEMSGGQTSTSNINKVEQKGFLQKRKQESLRLGWNYCKDNANFHILFIRNALGLDWPFLIFLSCIL